MNRYDVAMISLRVAEIERMRERIRRMERDSGWNDEGIYNRDWKKDLSAARRELRALEKDAQ